MIFSKRAQQFEASGIRKIFDMATTLKNPINFSIGQPDFGVTNKVKAKVIEAINKNFSQYTPTQGILPLRKKVSEKFKKENNIKKNADEILITAGTSASLFLSLSCLIDTKDEVIIPDPYFVEYPELVKFLGGKPVFLDTYASFQIDPGNLEKLINNKTKIIILNSPNNPTGAVYSKKNLEEIAKIAQKNNLIIISDEIYEKFIYDGMNHFSIGSIFENTITIGGLSKSGGMPGWRLGWATGPKEIIQKMTELQQYIFVCAPSLVQYGALEAFDGIAKQRQQYQEKRNLIYNLLSKKFKIVKPQGAFYIMVEVGNGEKFTKWAISQNVLLVPGNVFSQKNSHIRISYATSLENIARGAQICISSDTY